MTYLEWEDEDYSVGIDQFDSQHKQLFDALNELHTAMMEGEGREEVERILDSLEAYTETHFSDEEGFMQDCSYQRNCQSCFADHQSVHRDFEAEGADFRERYESGEVMLTMDVIDFLKEWLTTHIGGSEMDQDYGSYYASRAEE